MEIKNFTRLISLIQQKPQFLQQLPRLEQQFLVKIYKITELNTKNITELYLTMQKKFYLNRKTSNEEAWYQNQLRIFIWLLFGYLYVFQKQMQQLNEEDWKFFSPIFNYKSIVFFQFQSISLIRSNARPALWSQQQTSLLETIISEKNYKNRWNSIARELFIRSAKKFFRNPKQCRERWMNHLDPSKIHTEWTASQDLTLLNCIKKKGKRWSVAMKQLENTRTEHMVKNRYKSLISNQSKRYPGKKQGQLENILIKKLSKFLEKNNKESPKELLKQELKPTKQSIDHESQKLQIKEENQEICIANQVKCSMKEDEVKIEDQNNGFNFAQNIGDFNQFQVNSPMFIPWHEEKHVQFDIEDRERNEDHFCPNISSYNSQDLPF